MDARPAGARMVLYRPEVRSGAARRVDGTAAVEIRTSSLRSRRPVCSSLSTPSGVQDCVWALTSILQRARAERDDWKSMVGALASSPPFAMELGRDFASCAAGAGNGPVLEGTLLHTCNPERLSAWKGVFLR